MLWIHFQEFEILAGNSLDGFRQSRKGRLEASRGAVHSDFLESPFCLLLMRLPHKEIELAGFRVRLNLLVPVFPFFVGQPAKELRNFLAGKFLDIGLELVNFRHHVSLSGLAYRP